MNNTLIENIVEGCEDKFEDNFINENDIKNDILLQPEDIIFDFSLPQTMRLKALDDYYQINPNNIHEIISKLNTIYCMNTINLIRKFLVEICKCTNIPTKLKIDCAHTLYCNESSRDIGLKCLYDLHPQFINLPTPFRLKQILFLINSGYEDMIDILYNLIISKDINISFRYKILLSLENSFDVNYNNINDIILNACDIFLNSESTLLEYKILTCQYILSKKNKYSKVIIDKYENILLDYVQNKLIPHNKRADACDVLLYFGSNDSIQIAKINLNELSGKNIYSIYDDKENAHIESINQSVKKIIESLDTLNLSPIPTFDNVIYHINKYAKKIYRSKDENGVYNEKLSNEEEKIKTSLLRIEIDRTIFKDINHSLKSILKLLYVYIQKHLNKNQLMKRLLEELIDMEGTCSSGYINRLINILSGFGIYNLQISWEEQITANLAGRLNCRIKKDKNMNIILEELMNDNIQNKFNFLHFFRKNISSIKEEMYLEFRDHIDDCDWDLYFKKAILNYEK